MQSKALFSLQSTPWCDPEVGSISSRTTEPSTYTGFASHLRTEGLSALLAAGNLPENTTETVIISLDSWPHMGHCLLDSTITKHKFLLNSGRILGRARSNKQETWHQDIVEQFLWSQWSRLKLNLNQIYLISVILVTWNQGSKGVQCLLNVFTSWSG